MKKRISQPRLIVLLIISLILLSIIPFNFIVRRDLLINGIPTTGTIVDLYQRSSKGSLPPVTYYQMTYPVDGETRHGTVVAPAGKHIGEHIALIYAPVFPSSIATTSNNHPPWNEGLVGMLVLNLVFLILVVMMFLKLRRSGN